MEEKKNAMEEAVGKIEAQQAGLAEWEPAFMVGEQLKEMCRRIPGAAELIAQDLEREGMSLRDAEAKIRERADELHKKVRGGKASLEKRAAHDKTDEAKEKDAKAGKGKKDEKKAAVEPKGGGKGYAKYDAVCVSPREAEAILRKFYGIPEGPRGVEDVAPYGGTGDDGASRTSPPTEDMKNAAGASPRHTEEREIEAGASPRPTEEREIEAVPDDDFIDLDSFL